MLKMHATPSFGLINNTNGFHPLWMLITLIASATTHGKMSFLTNIYAVQSVCYFSGAALVGMSASKQTLSRIVSVVFLLLILSYPEFQRAGMNGLETGVHLLAIGLALNAAVRFSPSLPYAVVFGLTLSVLMLSRIERVFLAVLLLACRRYPA